MSYYDDPRVKKLENTTLSQALGFVFESKKSECVPFPETTRLIEQDTWDDDNTWKCEGCGEEWYWEGHPKGYVNYCPACGRKVAEYVDYKSEGVCEDDR